MRSLISALSITVMVAACKKSDVAADIPVCIKSNIEANKNQPYWNVKQVDEYQYQGKLVYVYEAETVYPDMQTPIFSSDCAIICTLGGIAGTTTCNGENFSNKSTFIRTVWRK